MWYAGQPTLYLKPFSPSAGSGPFRPQGLPMKPQPQAESSVDSVRLPSIVPESIFFTSHSSNISSRKLPWQEAFGPMAGYWPVWKVRGNHLVWILMFFVFLVEI